MRCSKCGSNNPAGKKFCEDCGAPLVNPCPKCGAETTAGKGFCGECGVPVAATSVNVEPRESTLTGERRYLTVLFCDLVSSTEIAARLDPEEWREVVAGYHRAATEAITRYGGHVAKYLGDGVMAHFGWPEAHENDAERATRAGLAILEEVSKFNQQSTYPNVSVRVGIDSGTVVVGAGAGKEADVFGEPPNIAARVQNAAAPDTLLVTASTHRLVSGLFVVEDLGPQELKGVAKQVELYRVVRSTGVRGRLAAARGLTPFVFREEELRLLLSRWERARDGEGQLVLVVGEAGIGKSRMVVEFHERTRDTPHIWMECAGEQLFENTPLHAISEMLSHWLELQGGTDPNDRLDRLDRALASAGLKPEEAAPLVADLLQLPVGERYPAISLNPEQKRRRLLAALTGWVLGAARVQPLVLFVEDLHWLDPSSLELLQLLGEQGATVPLMLICTARPEFRAPWPMRAHHGQITLDRLSSRDVREMVALVAARNTLAEESVEVVIERAGGVPLFIEELTRAVLESGAVKLSAREVPVTLHDSLMARLDRLGSAKSVLQLGSVIGGEFSYQLMRVLHPGSELELQDELRKLTDADLLSFRGIAPDATYQFKHALIRDAAYEALLKSRRRGLHALAAQTINERFPSLREAHPEMLARHWMEAEQPEPASLEWARAGNRAESRAALSEAQQFYEQALRLVSRLPESPDRNLRELELWQALVRVLQIIKGYSDWETVAANEQVAVLAEKSGNPVQLITQIIASFNAAIASGDFATAEALADQVLEPAAREGSSATLGLVHGLQIITHYWPGHFAKVEKHLAEGIAAFEDRAFAQFPGVAIGALGFAAWNAWTIGRADLARQRVAQMMAISDVNNAFDAAFSHVQAANLQIFIRNYEQAQTLAARSLELSRDQFPMQAAMSLCLLGVARAQLGQGAEGVELAQQGVALWHQIGMGVGMSWMSGYLATAQECTGSLIDALNTVEQALASAPAELAYLPEALRLLGELHLKLEQREEAERDFRHSVYRARETGAKAWELRSTMSVARLLVSQGRCEEARAILGEIYNWFTEGFDTADLKEAKALLEDLGQ